MKKFEFFDHTSDVGIRAFGKTIDEAFENSALAVFEIMTDTSKVRPLKKIEVNVNGFDMENLLYKWIEVLLAEYDDSLTLFSKFKVKVDKEKNSLTGEAIGEKFDPGIHERRTVVKAMTYHELEIAEDENGWKISFVVDI
ncbi:archease [Sulfuracidifex metallicus]|uniref:Protein archease n=1 Tax=Sulfuracidifex metallicus DSM 6482 = JCM 9184 TaxID=523847 RepID=A0A6A9QJU5_SULME|nr:archease [Sulfuracidifex metallicus]MUN28530.1 archease [Sulfuracidifex metallicus DSM 6482 = JCM 9184]WOE50932.1 archease [Sulfuracidifex metallicus DSM 6482 = JCM 9184]